MRTQWLMLGPISFVNHLCIPNIRFDRIRSVMKCISVREIKEGDEILVMYDRNYFGLFNVDCCCPYRSLHQNPCPPSPEPRRKKKKNASFTVSTPISSSSGVREKLSNSDVCSRFRKKERFLNSSSDDSEAHEFVDYENMYSPLEPLRSFTENSENNVIESPHNISLISYKSTVSNNNCIENRSPAETSPQNFDFLATCSQMVEVGAISPPNYMSTPISLQQFENPFETDVKFYSITDTLEDDSEDELFIGSNLSSERFLRNFDYLRDKHKLSKLAKDDLLKLFSVVLPQPNNIKSKSYIPLIPNLIVTELGSSTIVTTDLLTQLQQIVERNIKSIELSWSANYSWCDPLDHFNNREIQLVLNIDGASVFKSRNISVWPVWVQMLNLPPLLRCSDKNMSLLALWHGEGKPDFKIFLDKIVYELKTALNRCFDFEGIGKASFVARSLVCDMPATAHSLCMSQHMGYFSCTFCVMKGKRYNNRMLFPVKAAISLRTNDLSGVPSNLKNKADQS